jgi:hypothetical protein
MDGLRVRVQYDSVSFFDSVPRPPRPPEIPRREPKPWDGPPAGWIAGWVPWRIVLLRSGDAHAVLRDFEALPTGLQFSLVTTLRRDPMAHRGHHAPFFAPGEQGMRLGVAFADGRKAVAGLDMNRETSRDPSQPVLRPGGGGGSGSTYRLSFWLWPLPPPGPLTWVAQWPEHNLAENSVNVDATVLAAAASEAEQLWQVNPNELDRTTTRHVLGS